MKKEQGLCTCDSVDRPRKQKRSFPNENIRSLYGHGPLSAEYSVSAI